MMQISALRLRVSMTVQLLLAESAVVEPIVMGRKSRGFHGSRVWTAMSRHGALEVMEPIW